MNLRRSDPEEVGMSTERVRRAARLAEGWVAQGLSPSISVLAARKGVVVLHETFGRLMPEPDAPPAPLDAIYALASISKPITATTAMILVDDGLLGLNRPVQEYVPEFVGEGKDAVMVHHLLTHTSGLRDEEVNAHLVEKKASGQIDSRLDDEQPILAQFPRFLHFDQTYDIALRGPPGTEMTYSGYNYNLLGEIVQRVTSQSLDRIARERIFVPLGMRDTSYTLPDALRHRVVETPRGDLTGSFSDSEFLYSSGLLKRPFGANSVFSTARDLGTFGQMFLDLGRSGDTRVLSRASVAAMTSDQIPGMSARIDGEFFPEAGWSYGWGVCEQKHGSYGPSLVSAATIEHFGSTGVYVWIDPTNEIVGVYLSAMTSFPRGWCGDLFANAVMAAIDEA